MQGPPPAPPPTKHYDLRKGIYSVAVSIGKTRQSALQEGAEEIGQILQAQPQLMPILGPTYMKYRTFPGHDELADILKKMRDKQFPFLAGDDSGQPTPEQSQAQVQALQQQLQVMGAQMQAAMEQIKTEQAKQQATIAKAQIDAQTKVQIAQTEQQTQLLTAKLESELEQIRLALQQGHEARMQQQDQVHEAAMGATDAAHAAATNMAALQFKAANTVPLENPPTGKEI